MEVRPERGLVAVAVGSTCQRNLRYRLYAFDIPSYSWSWGLRGPAPRALEVHETALLATRITASKCRRRNIMLNEMLVQVAS